MCEFTQREYSCGHFRFIAARWCNLYKITHRRCQPDVTHFEFRQHEICGICQPYEMPPWFHSVKVRSLVTTPATTAPTASAAASTLTTGCPSSCVRKRRSSASKQKASITISSNAGMSPKKAKPSRPPIPLFSSTKALTSHRAA